MSRAHHSASGEPSQRMLRVGELIRHAMSELLSRGEISDPVLETLVITVPGVRMSPDLKLATIFVIPLGGGDVKPVIAALDRHKKISAWRNRAPHQSEICARYSLPHG